MSYIYIDIDIYIHTYLHILKLVFISSCYISMICIFICLDLVLTNGYSWDKGAPPYVPPALLDSERHLPLSVTQVAGA